MPSNASSSTTDARQPAMASSTPDNRPTIVLLHGTRLTGASWAAQVEDLGEEFHCLTPDLPGHGDAEDVPFTVAGAAERVADLIAAEAHGGRAVLVGLSLGGYVAMDVAARWPDRVTGLAISGATAEPVAPRSVFYIALATLFRFVPEWILAGANSWFFRHRYPPRIADPILANGFSFRGGSVALRALVGQRFKPRLAAWPGRTLIVNGELDLFFRPTERSFAEVAANPRRVLIRRATHLVNLDQPEAFSAAIRHFARLVSAG
jgi:pimeloyl-ACP methyl ester carboxylesterase